MKLGFCLLGAKCLLIANKMFAYCKQNVCLLQTKCLLIGNKVFAYCCWWNWQGEQYFDLKTFAAIALSMKSAIPTRVKYRHRTGKMLYGGKFLCKYFCLPTYEEDAGKSLLRVTASPLLRFLFCWVPFHFTQPTRKC